jgi:hypothetical protein
MILNYALTLITNPIFILSRIWKIGYIPLVWIFKLPYDNHNTIAHSHLLSLIYSIIITIITPYSYYLLYNNYWDSIQINAKLVEFVYNISVSYFISDLLIGMQFYPEILNSNIITSYVHHLAYIGLFVYGKYYNRYHLYLLGLPYEIPTILLNLGYINRNYRNNTLFGILFFVFRIVHNLYLLYKTFIVHNDLFIFSLFTFILHCNWFTGYVKKYILKIK